MKLQGGFAKGFTLIELISVVVLLSILGVVALSRFDSVSGFDSAGYFFDTLNAVRFGQKLAVATGCRIQVTISASQYALHQGATGCNDTSFTLPVRDPVNRGSDYLEIAPTGVTISPASVFVFTPESSVEGLSGDTTFTINGRQFTVFQNTGYVDVL